MTSDTHTPTQHSWPDALDACIAAAQYHTVLFENDHVRVLLTIIPPGHTVPVHTHRWPSVQLFKSWSPFLRRDPQGRVTLDRSNPADAPQLNAPLWLASLPPHTVENLGPSEINSLQIEIKSAS